MPVIKDPRKVWHIFAENYYLFRGTPSRLWLDYAFQEQFGLTERLDAPNADLYYDTIAEKLADAGVPSHARCLRASRWRCSRPPMQRTIR